MIETYNDGNNTYKPKLGKETWIHETAVVIGKVTLGEEVSIWPYAVIRGDVNTIKIGNYSNVQDGTVIHATHPSIYNETGYATIVGDEVTVGHSVILHGCQIGNRVLIGMGSTILDNSTISDDIIIGANSLVPMNKTLESGYLYVGSPVKAVRPLNDKEKEFLRYSAKHYAKLKNHYQPTEK